jgi:hypothetical protein
LGALFENHHTCIALPTCSLVRVKLSPKIS